jgi:hypothetical protein
MISSPREKIEFKSSTAVKPLEQAAIFKLMS